MCICACMFVYVSVCVYHSMCVFVYCAHVYVHVCVPELVCTYVCVPQPECVWGCMLQHVCMCTAHLCVCIQMCAFTCVCLCVSHCMCVKDRTKDYLQESFPMPLLGSQVWWPIVLVTFCCWDKTLTRTNLGRKVFISAYRLKSHYLKPGQNSSKKLGTGTEAEIREEHCLLACSQTHHVQLSSHSPVLPAQGWQHSQCAGPSVSTGNKEKTSQISPKISLLEAISPIKFLLPRVLVLP